MRNDMPTRVVHEYIEAKETAFKLVYPDGTQKVCSDDENRVIRKMLEIFESVTFVKEGEDDESQATKGANNDQAR
jgi:hypothetical protein